MREWRGRGGEGCRLPLGVFVGFVSSRPLCRYVEGAFVVFYSPAPGCAVGRRVVSVLERQISVLGFLLVVEIFGSGMSRIFVGGRLW